MAKKSVALDQYTNRTQVAITMSGANTLTFSQIRFAAGVFQQIAIILNKVKYYVHFPSLRELAAATDAVHFGITNRDDLTAITPTNLSVLDVGFIVGMGAGVEPIETPITHDFTNLPGGGLLLPANPLFVAMHSAGFAAAGSMDVVIEYQFKKLSDKESVEVLQTLIPGSY